MGLEWIDTHAHLEYDYPVSVAEYLEEAARNGVKQVITIGTDPASLEALPKIADQFEAVHFTIGMHPHEAKDFTDEIEKKMEALHSHPKCVGVGEIGLDYFYDHSPRDIQKTACAKQLELARKWNLPVVIHTRDAEDDQLALLKSHLNALQTQNSPLLKDKARPRIGVIHCFSGTVPFAKECLKLGFYLSFSGIVTFKKADDLRAAVAVTPLDRVLLETDAPYLAPVPHRGKQNQSAYLPATAAVVAQTLKIELTELSSATVENSKSLFNLK